MSKPIEKIQILSVTLIIMVCISACGGGNSRTEEEPSAVNNAPIANDDSAISINGNTVTVNVLNNDNDSNGDDIKISAISVGPENGVAIISGDNSTIEYTPNESYLGTDTITYVISDGSLNASATVELTANQSITLSGSVVDSLISGTSIVATVGSNTFETTTDNEGLYTLEISTVSLEEMISLRAYGSADNDQEFIELVSIVEDFSGLIAANNGDDVLTSSELHSLNITQLSTSLFLLTKDLNEEQLFTSFSNYEPILEQVDIDEALQAAGVIKLFIEDSNYNNLLTQNILTQLDDPSGEFTTLAIEELAEEAGIAGITEETFTANVEAAINESLKDTNVTQPITPDLFVNKRIVQTEAVRAGWIAPYGRAMEFADDGTFTLYRSGISAFNLNIDEIQLTTSGTWSISGSNIDMNYTTELESSYLTVDPTAEELSEKYGEDIALAFSEAANSFLIIDSELKETGRSLHLVVSTPNIMKVRIDTTVTETITLPQDVIDVLNDGRTEVSYINNTSKGYDLRTNISTLLETSTDQDIEGDWALSIPRFFAPISFRDEYGEVTEFLSRGAMYVERAELNSDGSTSTLFTETEFDWSLDLGKIILTAEDERLEYTPYYQVNKQWLALVEHYQNDQLLDVFVEKMAQFDDSYTQFTNELVTELPLIYNSNILQYQSSRWRGDFLEPEFIFGYQFNEDGSMTYGVAAEEETNINGTDNLFFTGNTNNWSWSYEDRQITLKNSSDIFLFNERYIEVLSTDAHGRSLIFEYIVGEFTGSPRSIFLPSRLNILTIENLEQWPEAWENTNLQ